MAPETMWIEAHMRSDHQVELHTQFYQGTNEETLHSRKLLCTLLDKKHYVCFSENLQFYINRGMRLTKVRQSRNMYIVHLLDMSCTSDYVTSRHELYIGYVTSRHKLYICYVTSRHELYICYVTSRLTCTSVA